MGRANRPYRGRRHECGYFRSWYIPSIPGLIERTATSGRKAIIAQGEKLSPLLRQAWASFGQREADIRNMAAALDVPVWVAWTSRDRVIPLRACMPAIQRLKHHKISRYDAGHASFLEQPDAFARDFQQWMMNLPA
jgi:pimeloyl-ACP methyl ester carboxylesterase